MCFERFGRYLKHVVDLKLEQRQAATRKRWMSSAMVISIKLLFDLLAVKTRVTDPSYGKPLRMAAAGNMYKLLKSWVCPSATCSCTIICALLSFWNPKRCEIESKIQKDQGVKSRFAMVWWHVCSWYEIYGSRVKVTNQLKSTYHPPVIWHNWLLGRLWFLVFRLFFWSNIYILKLHFVLAI